MNILIFILVNLITISSFILWQKNQFNFFKRHGRRYMVLEVSFGTGESCRASDHSSIKVHGVYPTLEEAETITTYTRLYAGKGMNKFLCIWDMKMIKNNEFHYSGDRCIRMTYGTNIIKKDKIHAGYKLYCR